ncbi:HD domain-containing phosphohydrolase [Aquabacterium sp. A08]|uniref:HD domain-containing phosphohydrolase n=1 Tax=Aquabacterium sp. A08 TaxID=2718532 RepID=UPI00141DA16D|nr:HD domain-containing phosphohydrolase [Aquabacterium sp. A08]NIC40935.1 HD domain-containing protein [Aquabacterium sp. A08]
MSPNPQRLLSGLSQHADTLTQRLQTLHQHLLDTVPAVDRIACALYDAQEDTLKTFINSTRAGRAISGYEYKLSDSQALSALARSGEFRVLDDIAQMVQSNTGHAQWLREQGYRSSFTVPLYDGGQLQGFVFFDSLQTGAFSPEVQRDLVLYSNLIGMAIASEFAAVRSVLEATRVARELAEVRDFETGAHLERMARYSRVIALAVALHFGLNDEFVESVYLFSSLHDIGKIGIPDKVLLKPGKLDAAERVVMEGHVDKGVQIIDRIVGTGAHQRLPDSTVLRNIVHCHHEYLDGSGYPRGLRGDAVPVEARIVTVADIFDALTALRPYKQVWTPQAALGELDRMVAAGQLDPACVRAVHEHLPEILAIRERYNDEPA